MYVCLWLICVIVWQKPAQNHGAIILQLKNFLKGQKALAQVNSKSLPDLGPERSLLQVGNDGQTVISYSPVSGGLSQQRGACY